MHLLHKSELMSYVRSLPRPVHGDMFSVYADQGYAASAGLETPFFDGAINAVHEAYNQAMASARICVEWSFAEILCYWASLDMKRMQQLLSNRKIGQVYLVAGLLTNFKNCLTPNKTSQYFKVPPPCLEEYLRHLQGQD
jgi:Gpi18-like mannosyltransferase